MDRGHAFHQCLAARFPQIIGGVASGVGRHPPRPQRWAHVIAAGAYSKRVS
jgi:hypothetical protein